MAKLIQLIETERKAGKGQDGDPVRLVRQYFTPEGVLVAEVDDWLEAARARWAAWWEANMPVIDGSTAEGVRPIPLGLLLTSAPHRGDE